MWSCIPYSLCKLRLKINNPMYQRLALLAGYAAIVFLAREVPLTSTMFPTMQFFEKHEYHALTPDHKKTLRLKRGHVGSVHGGNCKDNVNGNGNSNRK
jgi:hypothetical protein